MNFFENVKKVLLEKIQTMASCPEPFVRNPGSDFTRTRKLDFETTIRCLIAMESGSLKRELLELLKTSPRFFRQIGSTDITSWFNYKLPFEYLLTYQKHILVLVTLLSRIIGLLISKTTSRTSFLGFVFSSNLSNSISGLK